MVLSAISNGKTDLYTLNVRGEGKRLTDNEFDELTPTPMLSFADKRELRNESSAASSPPPLAPVLAIMFMRFAGLVFVAATFLHNRTKAASGDIFLCYFGWTPARRGGRDPLFSRSESDARSIPNIIFIPPILGETSS